VIKVVLNNSANSQACRMRVLRPSVPVAVITLNVWCGIALEKLWHVYMV